MHPPHKKPLDESVDHAVDQPLHKSFHTPFDLATLQRWMQAVIMHPGGAERGLVSAEAEREIPRVGDSLESLIKPSSAMTSLERMEIYAGAYYARLLECLRAEFPITAKAVGEEVFGDFAVGYLQRYPSTSYTLCRLGANFPRFRTFRKVACGWYLVG